MATKSFLKDVRLHDKDLISKLLDTLERQDSTFKKPTFDIRKEIVTLKDDEIKRFFEKE